MTSVCGESMFARCDECICEEREYVRFSIVHMKSLMYSRISTAYKDFD